MDEQEVREIVRRAVLKSLGITEAATSQPESPPPNPSASPQAATKSIALGADHGGFALKETIRGYLRDLGYSLTDCGTHNPEPVDYPDIAWEVARMVAGGQAWRGIIINGAGIGSAMAANKVPGVRAALCYDLSTAKNAREHNDANVLALGGRLIGEDLAKQIVKTFLETEFGGGRHARRVEKITAIEKRFLNNPEPVENKAESWSDAEFEKALPSPH